MGVHFSSFLHFEVEGLVILTPKKHKMSNQFDNPQVFAAVMERIGPQIMLYAAVISDYDNQINAAADPQVQAELREKRQRVIDEGVEFVTNFLTTNYHNPAH